MAPEKPNEAAAALSEDMEFCWARPEFWLRALAYTMLFVVFVAGTPALIGMLIGGLWAVDDRALEHITIIVSAALMPCFVVTLRQKYLQKHCPHPYAFLMRVPKRDRFAMMLWMLPTGVAVATASEAIQWILALEFDHTWISAVMAPLLYIVCVNTFGERVASPRAVSE